MTDDRMYNGHFRPMQSAANKKGILAGKIDGQFVTMTYQIAEHFFPAPGKSQAIINTVS
jgi:hypothetical protein